MTRPGSHAFWGLIARRYWHIDLITEHLKAVTLGQIKWLLINMPQNRHPYRRLVQPRPRHVSFSAIERTGGEFKRLHCAYSDLSP
jgi:hypothetical protein